MIGRFIDDWSIVTTWRRTRPLLFAGEVASAAKIRPNEAISAQMNGLTLARSRPGRTLPVTEGDTRQTAQLGTVQLRDWDQLRCMPVVGSPQECRRAHDQKRIGPPGASALAERGKQLLLRQSGIPVRPATFGIRHALAPTRLPEDRSRIRPHRGFAVNAAHPPIGAARIEWR